MKNRYFPSLLIVFLLLFSGRAFPEGGRGVVTLEGVVARDTVLEGEVRVSKDVYVPPGVTLTFRKGTRVVVSPTESTKVEPENLLQGTEVTVAGRLVAEGCTFSFNGGGGIALRGGLADLKGAVVREAFVGVLLFSGEVDLRGAALEKCTFGVVSSSDSSVRGLEKLTLTGTEYPLILPAEWRRGKDGEGVFPFAAPRGRNVSGFGGGKGVTRVVEDLFVQEDTTLSGTILVKGVIRVAPGAHLTLKPGTRLLFAFRDTNGDGIGENGLFLQGTLLAAGTEREPIFFGPADASSGKRGLWDSINFTASDAETNVLSHVVVSGAYRGIHSHFSDLSLEDVTVTDSLRGIQFQESTVAGKGIRLARVVTGIRCRDSDVTLRDVEVGDCVSGVHMLRVKGLMEDVRVGPALLYGFRVRESVVEGRRLFAAGGVYGFSLQEAEGSLEFLKQRGAALAGLMGQRSTLSISRSLFEDNGLYGLSFRGGKYVLAGLKIRRYGDVPINREEDPEIEEFSLTVEK